jgi:hypothetical protein
MKRTCAVFFSILLATGSVAMNAQVVPSATARQISVTAGGMASIFQTDYEGDWDIHGYPIAHSNTQPLFGVGAYVDVTLTRWLKIEAEGRWQRFHKYNDIHQDNYLIGPRVPVYHFRNVTVSGKVLVGCAKMNFSPNKEHGRFTDIAFGGGMDVKLTKKLSWRALDVEYQYWPSWGNSSLSPYGASMGIGYKFF